MSTSTYREENDVQAWIVAVEEAADALPDDARKTDIVMQAHQLEVDLRNLNPAELGAELHPVIGIPLRWLGLDAVGRIKSHASDLAARIASITGSNPLDQVDQVGGAATRDQADQLDGGYLSSAGVFAGDVASTARDEAKAAGAAAKSGAETLLVVAIALLALVVVFEVLK